MRSGTRAVGAAAVIAAFIFVAGCGPKAAPASPAPPPKPAPAASPVPAPPGPARSPIPSATPATTTPAAPAPLLGHVTHADLRVYGPWALLWEQRYVPDPAAVAAIKAHAKDFTVLLVMGTWCPDSKRELPRYFATMEAAGIGDWS